MDGWYNPYLAAPFIAWFVAQSIKFVRSALRGQPDVRYFYLSGQMPSAHSAAVTALAVTTLIRDGFTSPIFGVVGLFSAVVIYDSFGVRRASGDQAVAINAILRSLKHNKKVDISTVKLREVLGHKPSEVIAGVVLGGLIAVIMNYSELRIG